jgi:hypothetical protein
MSRPLPFTVEEFKQEQLFGIPLVVRDAAGTIHTYTDATIEKKIRAAVSYLERILKVDMWPRKVLCRPEVTHPGAVQGEDYDIAEDPLDYDATTYYANGYFRLRRWPVISLERLQLRYPADQPLLTYPTNWIRLNRKGGQVNIIAIAGNSSPVIIGREGGYLPLLTGQLLRSAYPQLIFCDYTSGIDFTDPQNRENWEDLFLAIQWQAAIYCLAELGRGTKPGITSQSLSQDGQSQSQSFSRTKGGLYGNEIAMLQEQLTDYVTTFKQSVKGFIFTVL